MEPHEVLSPDTKNLIQLSKKTFQGFAKGLSSAYRKSFCGNQFRTFSRKPLMKGQGMLMKFLVPYHHFCCWKVIPKQKTSPKKKKTALQKQKITKTKIGDFPFGVLLNSDLFIQTFFSFKRKRCNPKPIDFCSTRLTEAIC